MSVTHDAKGRILILDQINGRIVRRNPDGSVDKTIPMQLRGAQDIAVAKDGSLAVMDRLADKAIALYDDSGNLKGQIDLSAVDGIGDTGLITSMIVDGDDVYVEREHGALLKIGDTSGNLYNPPEEIPGRPSRDGNSILNAGIVNGAQGRAWVSAIDRATGDNRFTRELRMGAVISQIVLLDSDKKGTIYFGLELHQDPEVDWVVVECLEPQQGDLIGSVELPANTLPEETLRDFTVLDDGGFVYALRSEKGVTYEESNCR